MMSATRYRVTWWSGPTAPDHIHARIWLDCDHLIGVISCHRSQWIPLVALLASLVEVARVDPPPVRPLAREATA